MTNANMKLVFLSVSLPDALETPDQKLEEGEFITKRVVAIKDLLDELKGKSTCLHMLFATPHIQSPLRCPSTFFS